MIPSLRVTSVRMAFMSAKTTPTSGMLARVEGADYVAFGSFFPSATKPAARRAGMELLMRARALGIPVVAIGGITPENAPLVINAGADAVAVISAVFDAREIEVAARAFTRLFERPARRSPT